ncbi:MAG: PilZ domain-containing protein [Deltaproteobacteria bacterium]|nr:PilZ domain-containing protein [Deltaproteobacteria bacterium]
MVSEGRTRNDLRRSKRHPRMLLVELIQGGHTRMLQSVDVGRHGLFVAHPEPPRDRQILMLNIHLPDGPIRATAIVSRQVLKGPDGSGMGLQFFTLAEDAKARWDRFIGELDGQKIIHEGEAPRADVSSFYVKPRDMDRLQAFHTEQLIKGIITLNTPVLREVGATVMLVVVHPETTEEFTLRGTVTGVSHDRPKRMEIRFAGVTPELVDAFGAFMRTGQRPRTVPPPAPPPAAPPPVPHADAVAPPTMAPLFEGATPADDLIVEEDDLFEIDVEEPSAVIEEPIPLVQGALLQGAPAPIPAPSGRQAMTAIYAVADQLRRENIAIRVRCARCTMPEAALEVGVPPGVMALFAQVRPHWCPHCRLIVTGLRVDPNGARRRLLDALGPDMIPLMMSSVPLSFVFDALHMAQPPRCSWCGGGLITTHATAALEDRLWWLHEGDTQELQGAGGDCCPNALWMVHRVALHGHRPPVATARPTPHLDAFLRDVHDPAAPLSAPPPVSTPPVVPTTSPGGVEDGFLVLSNKDRRGPS